MKRKLQYLLLPLFAILAACNMIEFNNAEGKDVPKAHRTHYNILYKGNSAYMNYFLGKNEAFIQYSFSQAPYNEAPKMVTRERFSGPNTFSINDSTSLRLEDICRIENHEKTTTFHFTRDAQKISKSTFPKPHKVIAREEEREQLTQNTLVIDICTTEPISFIRPWIDDCNCIPMCYFDGMEIEWNQDPSNTNGIVIVAEWFGITMQGQVDTISVIGIDLVDDTGGTTLNSEIFDNMPDEALVNLWLIRGNLVSIGEDGNVSLSEFAENSEGWSEYLEDNPEFLFQLHTTMFATGAVTMMPMYLIRNL